MNFHCFLLFPGYIYLSQGYGKKAIIVLHYWHSISFVGALIGVNILEIAVAAYVAVNTKQMVL